ELLPAKKKSNLLIRPVVIRALLPKLNFQEGKVFAGAITHLSCFSLMRKSLTSREARCSHYTVVSLVQEFTGQKEMLQDIFSLIALKELKLLLRTSNSFVKQISLLMDLIHSLSMTQIKMESLTIKILSLRI